MASGKWGMYRTDGELPEVKPHPAPALKLRSGGIQPSVDLRDKCSAVKDQKTIGSCTACGVVSALEFLQLRNGPGAVPPLSVLFNYYNSRVIGGNTNIDGGAILAHAVAAPLAYGVCEEKNWPYDVGQLTAKPPAAAYNDATNFEAVQFARVAPGDELMRVLSGGFPVVTSTGFGGDAMNSAATTGHMAVYKTRLDEPGGHTMLLVGYDKNRKEWLFRNSWGPDFGQRGYFWCPDETFVTYTRPDGFWVIGDLEQSDMGRLAGASMSESIADMKANGPDNVAAAMKTLRTDLRKELQDDLEDAKKSARSRLRDAMTIKPKGGGNDGGNG